MIRRLDRDKNPWTFYLCWSPAGRPATVTYFILLEMGHAANNFPGPPGQLRTRERCYPPWTILWCQVQIGHMPRGSAAIPVATMRYSHLTNRHRAKGIQAGECRSGCTAPTNQGFSVSRYEFWQ